MHVLLPLPQIIVFAYITLKTSVVSHLGGRTLPPSQSLEHVGCHATRGGPPPPAPPPLPPRPFCPLTPARAPRAHINTSCLFPLVFTVPPQLLADCYYVRGQRNRTYRAAVHAVFGRRGGLLLSWIQVGSA